MLAKSIVIVAAMFIAAQGAAQSFPNKPVRLVIPYAPGGTTDLMARALQERFRKSTGQALVIENREGASGDIAAELVARAKPDGYTLLMGNNFMTSSPHTKKAPPYDPIRSFTPIGMVSVSPMLLVVHNSVPANNLSEFIAWAKAEEGGVNFGSAGAGTTGRLATELFCKAGGFKCGHIPYRGATPSVMAAVTGEVKMLLTTSTSLMMESVRSGKLKLLAGSAPEVSAIAPGTPLISEVIPGFSASVWFGTFAPAGTPQAVQTRLAAAFRDALSDPELQKQFLSYGLIAAMSTPQELNAMVSNETSRWESVVSDLGLKQ